MKKENTIKILKIEPNKIPYEKEITNDLKSLQAEVGGGNIEIMYLDGCLGIINEEGKINEMEYNRRMPHDIICGPFFICSDTSDGDFASITEEQSKRFAEYFKEIPEFSEQEFDAEPKITVIGFHY